ncbi:MAG: GNAT family N-acetyltransferase [bacterium]
MERIRIYQDRDKEAVLDFIHGVIRNEFPEVGIKKQINSFKDFFVKSFNLKIAFLSDLYEVQKEYFAKNGVFYIAEQDGKIIGTIALKYDQPKIARLKRLFVAKQYRGQGLAQTLFDKVLFFARQNHYEKIVLSTLPVMKQAQKFYQKNGFIVMSRDEKVHMEKILIKT